MMAFLDTAKDKSEFVYLRHSNWDCDQGKSPLYLIAVGESDDHCYGEIDY